jgi:hypothetical protein
VQAPTDNKGQGLDKDIVVYEFQPDQIVCRYGRDRMTYWNGEFNEREEGIFVAFPKREKYPLPQELRDKNNHSASWS